MYIGPNSFNNKNIKFPAFYYILDLSFCCIIPRQSNLNAVLFACMKELLCL